jgi:glycogen(starch) synthase
MNIVFGGVIFHENWLGGEPRVALDIARGLIDSGHKVQTLVRRRRINVSSLAQLLKKDMFECLATFVNPSDVHPNLLRHYLTYLKTFKPDILVGWFDYDSSLLYAAAKAGIPAVAAVHSYYTMCPLNTLFIEGEGVCPGPSSWRCPRHISSSVGMKTISGIPIASMALGGLTMSKLGQRKKFLSGTSAIVVPSEHLKRRLVEHGITEELVNVIPNGVDVNSFRGKDYAAGKKIVFLPFTWSPEAKGFYHFLKLAKNLSIKHPDACFMSTGVTTGTEDVHALGYIPRDYMLELLSKAYVVVIPSIWEEPFGLTILEAMAMGKPVVAYASGGIPEIIEDQITGYLAKTSNIDQLTSHVDKILSDSIAAARMGKAGRERAHKFDLSMTVRQYHELLSRVAN